MALRGRRNRFDAPPSDFEQQLIPVASVVIASLAPLLPVIATTPLMPPFGFIMLLSWRLLRNDLWPVWAALPLGAFDDLFSGAPLGSAMALWAIAFLAIDLIDRRFVWRDQWQDWGIASALIAAYLVGALLLVRLTGGGAPITLLLPQIALSALTFPLLARLAAVLDRWRFGR